MSRAKEKRKKAKVAACHQAALMGDNPAASASVPSSQKSPPNLWRWAALSWLVLLIAILGGLGEIAQNKEMRAYMYDANPTAAWLQARDMVASEKYTLAQWESPGPHIPELGVMALLYLLFDGDISPAMPLFAIIQIVFCALCLALLYSCLGSRGRVAALCGAPLALAAQAILAAWGADDLFGIMYYSLVHYSGFAFSLAGLWAVVHIIGECHKKTGREWFYLAACAPVFAFMTASEPLWLSWFYAPAIGAMVVCWFFGRLDGRALVLVSGTLLLSVIMFRAELFTLTKVSMLYQRTAINIADIPASVGVAAKTMWFAISRHPFLALLWAVAMILVFLCFWARVRKNAAAGGKKRKGKKSKKAKAFCSDSFILAFFFIAPFAPFAPAFLGFIKDYTADVYGNWEPLRTYLPTVFYPLFFALPLLAALLGSQLKLIGGRLSNKAARLMLSDYRAPVAVCCTLVIAAAAPLTVAAPGAFAPYTTPFYQCIKDAAQRENLKSGLASVRFRPAGVFGGVEKLGAIGDIGYARPHDRVFYPELSFANPEYLRGSFDFILVNSTKDGRLMYPPERDLCYPNSLENPKREGHYQCNPHPAQFGFYITGETTKARMGEPSKIVKCDNVELWTYRPPKPLR